MLGPTTPDPTIDLSQLEICRTVVENSPHKLFVGGLPCEWSEDMVGRVLGFRVGGPVDASAVW
jgi:hypothetical protein